MVLLRNYGGERLKVQWIPKWSLDLPDRSNFKSIHSFLPKEKMTRERKGVPDDCFWPTLFWAMNIFKYGRSTLTHGLNPCNNVEKQKLLTQVKEQT